jgi:hypothetical protein
MSTISFHRAMRIWVMRDRTRQVRSGTGMPS